MGKMRSGTTAQTHQDQSKQPERCPIKSRLCFVNARYVCIAACHVVTPLSGGSKKKATLKRPIFYH
jgi:hypothetical protein